MELRGPTLTLRYPAPGDAPALFELLRDREVGRWFRWWPFDEVAQPAAWIDGRQADRDAGVALEFVLVRDGEVLGVTSLLERNAADRHAMVGSWLGRPAWGTGANMEAKALICHLGFAVCGLERLGAYTDVENVRSRAALEKLGWVHEGTLRAFHRRGERRVDVHVLGLLRREWEDGPLASVAVEVDGAPPPVWLVD